MNEINLNEGKIDFTEMKKAILSDKEFVKMVKDATDDEFIKMCNSFLKGANKNDNKADMMKLIMIMNQIRKA